mgnify:CR=1 FL=1
MIATLLTLANNQTFTRKIPSMVTIKSERWLPIPGYEGFYSVSDMGRVRQEAGRFHCRGTIYVYHSKPRLKKLSRKRHGHLAVNIGNFNVMLVHRLVLLAFVGPCPEGMECRHLDGNPSNNRLDYLCWGTHAENMADTVRHGRTNRGERNPNAKLTDATVLEIRQRSKAGESRMAIARSLGLCQSTISYVALGKTWRHV